MKLLAATTVAFSLGLFSISTSQAMPLAPIAPAGTAPSSGDVILVAQGCGPGMHRGPRGACRPLFTCPRGWHTGPYGRRCVRNW
jgi:hypothetical protein